MSEFRLGIDKDSKMGSKYCSHTTPEADPAKFIWSSASKTHCLWPSSTELKGRKRPPVGIQKWDQGHWYWCNSSLTCNHKINLVFFCTITEKITFQQVSGHLTCQGHSQKLNSKVECNHKARQIFFIKSHLIDNQLLQSNNFIRTVIVHLLEMSYVIIWGYLWRTCE